MSSSTLPFTKQDDLAQKEKYAASQQHKNAVSRNCSSRRIRLWTLILLISIATLGLVTYFSDKTSSLVKINYFAGGVGAELDASSVAAAVVDEEGAVVIGDNNNKGEEIEEKPLSLKEEILSHIQNHELIVFSKTYCPFSMKAKRILNAYDLKDTLNVIEVDLRDDDYQVKMVLKEISGRETFPNIFLNGKSIGGSDTLEELHETGELKTLLQDHHLLSVVVDN